MKHNKIPLDAPSSDLPELTKLSYNYLRSIPSTYYTMSELIAMSTTEFKEFITKLSEVKL